MRRAWRTWSNWRVDFALSHLRPDGALVCKVFHGSGYSQLVKLFKDDFRVVKPIKPKASRDRSSETFLVGIGLKAVAARQAPLESVHDRAFAVATAPHGRCPASGLDCD